MIIRENLRALAPLIGEITGVDVAALADEDKQGRYLDTGTMSFTTARYRAMCERDRARREDTEDDDQA